VTHLDKALLDDEIASTAMSGELANLRNQLHQLAQTALERPADP
jgi:hypothetical protein